MTVMKVCYLIHTCIVDIIHDFVLMKEITFHKLAVLSSAYEIMKRTVLGPIDGSQGQEWGLAPSNGLSRTCFILCLVIETELAFKMFCHFFQNEMMENVPLFASV